MNALALTLRALVVLSLFGAILAAVTLYGLALSFAFLNGVPL